MLIYQYHQSIWISQVQSFFSTQNLSLAYFFFDAVGRVIFFFRDNQTAKSRWRWRTRIFFQTQKKTKFINIIRKNSGTWRLDRVFRFFDFLRSFTDFASSHSLGIELGRGKFTHSLTNEVRVNFSYENITIFLRSKKTVFLPHSQVVVFAFCWWTFWHTNQLFFSAKGNSTFFFVVIQLFLVVSSVLIIIYSGHDFVYEITNYFTRRQPP